MWSAGEKGAKKRGNEFEERKLKIGNFIMTIHLHPWNQSLPLKWIFFLISLNYQYYSILCNKLGPESHLSDSSSFKNI